MMTFRRRLPPFHQLLVVCMVAVFLLLITVDVSQCQYYPPYGSNTRPYGGFNPYGFRIGSGREFYDSNPYYHPSPLYYGQPLPSMGYEDPARIWEPTPEDAEAKRANPLPYIINPGVRRGTVNLGQLEAFANRGSQTRKSLLMPLLNIIGLNPS